MSIAIVPYVSVHLVDAIPLVATNKKYLDPMEWLANYIPNLFKEERKKESTVTSSQGPMSKLKKNINIHMTGW